MVNNITIKGLTILELTVVMVVVVVLLTTIISNCANLVRQAQFQATVQEMHSIAEASIDYYNSHASTWPLNLSLLSNHQSLSDNNMPQLISSNPFRSGGYQLSFIGYQVTVSTVIPKGILINPNEGSFLTITHEETGDQISITQNVPNEISGSLKYDLKYLYQ